MKYLTVFLRGELPDLKMSHFQVQLENVNEMYFCCGKRYISVYINTSAKQSPKIAKTKKLFLSINNPSFTKIHSVQKYELKGFPINEKQSNKQHSITF